MGPNKSTDNKVKRVKLVSHFKKPANKNHFYKMSNIADSVIEICDDSFPSKESPKKVLSGEQILVASIQDLVSQDYSINPVPEQSVNHAMVSQDCLTFNQMPPLPKLSENQELVSQDSNYSCFNPIPGSSKQDFDHQGSTNSAFNHFNQPNQDFIAPLAAHWSSDPLPIYLNPEYDNISDAENEKAPGEKYGEDLILKKYLSEISEIHYKTNTFLKLKMKERDEILNEINKCQKSLQTFGQMYRNINSCILFAEALAKSFDLNNINKEH